jgi:chromosome segregation ATPase
MEKKIQELKTKLLNDLEMFMHSSIEQFTSLLSDISNEYLVKTKERELELKDEIGKLSEQRDDLIIYINGAKESAKDFTEKMKKLDERENKIKLDEDSIALKRDEITNDLKKLEFTSKEIDKDKNAFEKEKQQFQIQKAMVEEQVKTLRKLNI